MRTIKALGLAIVAVLALSAVSASGASALLFMASKTGTLKGKALNAQLFKTGNGATVECSTAATTGTVTETTSKTQLVKVAYSGCKIGSSTATVSPEADYLFMIEPNFVKLENTVTITTTVGKCKIEVKPEGNEDLTSVAYKNNSGKIIEETTVSKITSNTVEGTESVCGKHGESKEGTYTGNNEIELEGGTIEVS